MSHREEFLEAFSALLKKYNASVVIECSEWAKVSINVSGNTGNKAHKLDAEKFKLNSNNVKFYSEENL